MVSVMVRKYLFRITHRMRTNKKGTAAAVLFARDAAVPFRSALVWVSRTETGECSKLRRTKARWRPARIRRKRGSLGAGTVCGRYQPGKWRHRTVVPEFRREQPRLFLNTIPLCCFRRSYCSYPAQHAEISKFSGAVARDDGIVLAHDLLRKLWNRLVFKRYFCSRVSGAAYLMKIFHSIG